jgi:hypothetical protein
MYKALAEDLFLMQIVRFLHQLWAYLAVILKISVLTCQLVLMTGYLSEELIVIQHICE